MNTLQINLKIDVEEGKTLEELYDELANLLEEKYEYFGFHDMYLLSAEGKVLESDFA